MEEECFGAPWILKEIIDGLEGKRLEEIKPDKKLRIILEHLELAVQEKGEYIGVREMRKHICWYLKNLKNSSKVREEINRLETKQAIELRLKEYFLQL